MGWEKNEIDIVAVRLPKTQFNLVAGRLPNDIDLGVVHLIDVHVGQPHHSAIHHPVGDIRRLDEDVPDHHLATPNQGNVIN